MRYLIVVDMQNDFIDGSLGTKEAQSIVNKVVEKIDGFDGKIAVTLDTHTPSYLNTQEGHILPVEHCIAYTNGWELNRDVHNALLGKSKSGTIIEEFRKDTFGSVELGDWLSQQEKSCGDTIDEITIIGICTDICVISNAMLIKAFVPEAPIVVDASCCAGVSPETHNIALAAMEVCQIKINNLGD